MPLSWGGSSTARVFLPLCPESACPVEFREVTPNSTVSLISQRHLRSSLTPAPHATPQVTPGHRAPCAGQQRPSSNLLRARRVHTSVLLSPFVPPSPSPAVFTGPFSTSASLFLPCKEVHQDHFSRFYMCAQKSPDTPGSPEGNTEGPGTASSEPLLPS